MTKYISARIWILGIHITLGSFLTGFNQGVFNTCQENVAATLHWGHSKDLWIALFSAMNPFGSIFGGLLAGPIASNYGRRGAMIIFSIIAIIGCLITIIPTTPTFGIGRFVSGVISGAFLTIPPLYISEISPPDMSGKVGCLCQTNFALGIAVSFALGLPLPTGDYNNNSFNYWWMFMFGFQLIVEAYLIFVFLFVYKNDTPYWLIEKKRENEAMVALKYIYTEEGIDEVAKQLFVDKELKSESEISLLNKTEVTPSYKELIYNRKYYKMLRLGCMMTLLLPWTGAASIVFYSTFLFDKIGGGTFMSRIYTLIVGVVNWLCVLLSLPFIDKWGRKPMMKLGVAGIIIDLVLLGIFSGIDSSSIVLPVIMTIIFLVLWAFSAGPILWLYCGEVMNDKGISIAISVCTLSILILVLTFPYMVTSLSAPVTFFIYAGITVGTLVYIWIDMIETKGLTKQQIIKLVLRENQIK